MNKVILFTLVAVCIFAAVSGEEDASGKLGAVKAAKSPAVKKAVTALTKAGKMQTVAKRLNAKAKSTVSPKKAVALKKQAKKIKKAAKKPVKKAARAIKTIKKSSGAGAKIRAVKRKASTSHAKKVALKKALKVAKH